VREEPAPDAIRRPSKRPHPDAIDLQMGAVRIIPGPAKQIKEIREMELIAEDLRLQREKK